MSSSEIQDNWFFRRLANVDRLERELEAAHLQIQEMAEALERVRVAVKMPAGVAQCAGDIAAYVEQTQAKMETADENISEE